MDRECTDKFLATARPTATGASSNDRQIVLHAAYAAIIRGDFDALIIESVLVSSTKIQ
jgi:hypothetical protein